MRKFIKNNFLLILLVSLLVGIVEALFKILNESEKKISYDKSKELERKSGHRQNVQQNKSSKFLFV